MGTLNQILATPAVELAPGLYELGRLGDGVLHCPADVTLSRKHAKIEVLQHPTRVRIQDCGSRNGTFVNGEQLTAHHWHGLVDRSVIRIGHCFLIVRMTPQTVPEQFAPTWPQKVELLGNSPEAHRLRWEIYRLATAAADDKVWIEGETGTGKEATARALHELSPRAAGPYKAVNCANLPESLAESTLFGHVEGAYTGAKAAVLGVFREAHRGSLFLDEVAELAPQIQAKLLRVVEDGKVTPLGSNREYPVDVRIIAATNAKIRVADASSGFRSDLIARLQEHRIHTPALRQRREDILPLIKHFWGQKRPDKMPPLQPNLIEALLHGNYYTNVRALKTVARRMVVEYSATGALSSHEDIDFFLEERTVMDSIVEQVSICGKLSHGEGKLLDKAWDLNNQQHLRDFAEIYNQSENDTELWLKYKFNPNKTGRWVKKCNSLGIRAERTRGGAREETGGERCVGLLGARGQGR